MTIKSRGWGRLRTGVAVAAVVVMVVGVGWGAGDTQGSDGSDGTQGSDGSDGRVRVRVGGRWGADVQLDALRALYKAAGGKEWSHATGWSSPLATHYCDGWYGVQCDSSSNVVVLSLPHNNLVGSLPEQLGALTHLTQMDMQGNRLEGTLPPGIGGSLEALERLIVSNNSLSGPIPSTFSGLLALAEVDLSYNKLDGSIPDLSELTHLGAVSVQGNNLDGHVPDWMACSKQINTCQAGHNARLMCQTGCSGNKCGTSGCQCGGPCASLQDCQTVGYGCTFCLPQGVCGQMLQPPPPSPPPRPHHTPPPPVPTAGRPPPPPPHTHLSTSPGPKKDIVAAIVAASLLVLAIAAGCVLWIVYVRRAAAAAEAGDDSETPGKPRERNPLLPPASPPDEAIRRAIRERATQVNTRYNTENYFAPPRPRADSASDRRVQFNSHVSVKILSPPPSKPSTPTSPAGDDPPIDIAIAQSTASE